MSPARRRAAGFTMAEVAVVVALFTLIVAAFGRAFVTASNLSSTSKAALLAHDDNRKSLDVVANTLRAAASDTVTGFDETGLATSVTFRRVTGVDTAGVKLYDEAETVSWRAAGAAVNGVASPGEVVLTKGSTTTVLAPRVPSGGFTLRRSGNVVRLTLTTYASTTQRRTATVVGETALSLRNS